MIVSYNGNGNTGGTAPASTTHSAGDVVILPDEGTLVRTGYTFFGWNTNSVAAGEFYLPENGYRATASDITFYATWIYNYVGGLVGGGNFGGTTNDSFWDTEESGVTYSVVGTGKTTEEMQTEATFTNWDFTNTWLITEGASYPSFYIVDFSVSDTFGETPYTVTFTNLTERWPDENAQVISRTWDFGDGYTSSDMNPTHTYLTPGIYYPSLTEYRNYLPGYKIVTSPITVLGEVPVDFVGVPRKGYINLTVQFTDLTTGGLHNAWYWDFGDGYTSTEQNPEHFYERAGIYTVTLTVFEIYGSYNLSYSATKVNYISVSSHITYDIAPDPDIACYLWGTALVTKEDRVGITINKRVYKGTNDEAGFTRTRGPSIIFD